MLSVIAFENISPEEEAKMFATINREQKQVSKKLLDELDGDLKWDSEIKREQISAIASRAIDLMRYDVGGPFFDKIASPGIDISLEQPLTLPELRKAIVSSGLIGKEVGKHKMLFPGAFTGSTNEESLQRLVDGLDCYFDKIRDLNPDRWELGRMGFICSNFGVPGHIRLLGLLAKAHVTTDKIDLLRKKPAEIIKYLSKDLENIFSFISEADDAEFEAKFKVKLGSGGIKEYIERLKSFLPTHFAQIN